MIPFRLQSLRTSVRRGAVLVLPCPDTQEKIALLAREACFDVAGPDESSRSPRAEIQALGAGTERPGGVPGNWGSPRRIADGPTGYIASPKSGRGPLLKV